MKQSKPKQLFISLCFFYLIALFGCYEPIEGCVEFWAVNYDVLADNLCEDCCTAPEVKVKIEYVIEDDSTAYRFGDTILLQSGSYLTLHSANVMLSHFELATSGLQVLTVNDSVTIDDVEYEQDFGFSKGQGNSISLTEYQEPFTVDSISFVQGLIPAWRDTSIFGLDNSILAEAIDSLYQEQFDDFAVFSCTISIDTIDQDTLHYVSSLRNTTLELGKVINGGYPLSLGEHTTVTLKVNIIDWFDQVTADFDDTEAVADQLISSLPDIMKVE